MRLTCPNCDAQYEVPDEVIPEEGRDVQCSNCGQTWFQHHPDHTSEEDIEDTDTDAPQDALEADLSDDGDEETAPPPPAPDPSLASGRKELDPAVADILRQEADAEQQARRNRSSDPLESQPDLGLAERDSAPAEDEQRKLDARKRMARMRGEPEPMSEAEVTAAAISSRRDLLPDIEEINSTLRTDQGRAGAEAPVEYEDPARQQYRKRGFRSGFLLSLVIFAVLALIYIYAPQIAQSLPQLDPLLSAYVTWVDQLRLWLDGHLQNLLRWLDNMALQSAS